MKKMVLALWLAGMGWTSLWAANRVVKGYVLDNEGTPLPGAYVHDEGSHTAVTDADGYFELSVPEEVRLLKADYVGFTALTHAMERPDDVQVLVMTPNTELEEVVVRAGGIGTVKSRIEVLNTESVTSQALTRAACCNLSESFVTNPSVDVAYSDAVTGAKQIQLLGLAGTYVQMLTENFPNLRGAAAAYGLDYIPGPWMQSIQVSKGAASVRNGYESVTGQIDVEYKKPKVADPLLVNLFASSAGRYEGNAVGAVELNDRLSTALFLNYYNETMAHDRNGDTFLDMPQMQSLSVMNRWHYQTPRFVSQWGIKALLDRRTSGQTEHTLGSNAGFAPYTIRNNANRMEAFAATRIRGTYNVVYPGHTVFAGDDHGTKVFSCLASRLPHLLVGTAPEASYWLIKSEETRTEFPIEEDYWAAAVEYADSVGVDVVSSSLGYFAFDDSTLNYTPEQLDGQTVLVYL